MTHFRMVYEGTAYAPAITSCRLELYERDGGWKGQQPGDTVTLHLSLQGSAFEYDVPKDEDEHLHIEPNIDTQWLTLPISLFAARDVSVLDGLAIGYDGPGSIDALTGEAWREPPGMFGTYGDQAFRRVRIDIARRDGSGFRLRLVGEAEDGTEFDVACEVPLGARLVSYTGQAGEDRLRRWFDTFLRWESFQWERNVHNQQDGEPTHIFKGKLIG